jgi:uracil-DNA glycosylase
MATVHPSSILRSPDSDTRAAEMRMFIADMKKIARLLQATEKAA